MAYLNKVTRTTFEADGVKEPCIVVSNDYAQVRISKYYHYVGSDTLNITEYIDGEFNSQEEWQGDYDLLSDFDAICLAKQYSAYLT